MLEWLLHLLGLGLIHGSSSEEVCSDWVRRDIHGVGVLVVIQTEDVVVGFFLFGWAHVKLDLIISEEVQSVLLLTLRL